jgi:5-formyltetrahydrofolate cyclo-ligase
LIKSLALISAASLISALYRQPQSTTKLCATLLLGTYFVTQTSATFSPNSATPYLDSKQALRKHLRQRRRNLSRSAQILAAQKLVLKISHNPLYRRAHNILFYWPSDGEISPLALMNHALKKGKQVYFPVVDPVNFNMQFHRFRRGDRLKENIFGIPEPLKQSPKLPAQKLDLVFMPLVGFDDKGNRLGMGGGFYDRAFAALRRRQPLRIGLAHSVQKVAQLMPDNWDIPLHGLCTEKHFYLF